MKWLKLTMVVDTRRPSRYGEDDGIIEADVTTPVMVAVEKIRNLYPRKPSDSGQPRVGTRISFENGAGMAVTETFDEVAARLVANGLGESSGNNN